MLSSDCLLFFPHELIVLILPDSLLSNFLSLIMSVNYQSAFFFFFFLATTPSMRKHTRTLLYVSPLKRLVELVLYFFVLMYQQISLSPAVISEIWVIQAIKLKIFQPKIMSHSSVRNDFWWLLHLEHHGPWWASIVQYPTHKTKLENNLKGAPLGMGGAICIVLPYVLIHRYRFSKAPNGVGV